MNAKRLLGKTTLKFAWPYFLLPLKRGLSWMGTVAAFAISFIAFIAYITIIFDLKKLKIIEHWDLSYC